ncbi:hypothetical protein GRAN_0802 [Granulicella sibirica]|uniref:AB hydrolase-1 domain-containing protein n=1 Tax=Granulicella sibirica TaxID=2479048 RepID=A0A4Q0T3J8_9BACT|nr:hypothetical protein GRAN_0802 [Granulicella sibirica]
MRVIGRGTKTLMLGHGFGCDQTMWRQVTPAFDTEYRIVLFDHMGSGLSDTSVFSGARYATLHGYARDVVDIIDEMKLEEIHFVGHSVSSMIGALATIARPDKFKSLTMIGPSPCYLNDGDYRGGFERLGLEKLVADMENNHVVWSATMAPLIVGKHASPMIVAELEACLCRMDPMLAHHFARVIFFSDLRDQLPQVRVPVLVMQCEDDIVVPPFVGEYVQQHIPDARLVMTGTPGHCPHMSSPKDVIREVRAFLESVEKRQVSPDNGNSAEAASETVFQS